MQKTGRGRARNSRRRRHLGERQKRHRHIGNLGGGRRTRAPAAQGRLPRRKSPYLRLYVRRLQGCNLLRQSIFGLDKSGRRNPDDGRRTQDNRQGSRTLHAVDDARAVARRGLHGLHCHKHQGSRPHTNRRHNHAHRKPRRRNARGLQGSQADGVLGAVPNRHFGIRKTESFNRQTATQRRGSRLYARNVGGTRIRLPLRLFGAFAYGNRAGTPAQGIRPRHNFDLPERRLQTRFDGRHADGNRQPLAPARPHGHSGNLRADNQGEHFDTHRVDRRYARAGLGKARVLRANRHDRRRA